MRPVGTAPESGVPVRLSTPPPESVSRVPPAIPPAMFNTAPASAPTVAAESRVSVPPRVLTPEKACKAPTLLRPEPVRNTGSASVMLLSCRAAPTAFDTTAEPPRACAWERRTAPAATVRVPLQAELSALSSNTPLLFFCRLLPAAENAKGAPKVRTLFAVTSMAEDAPFNKTPCARVKEPVARRPWVALLAEIRRVPVAPRAPAVPTWSTPAVISRRVPRPPKLLAALLSTKVPRPALVRATPPAATAAPESAPFKTRPCTLSEAEGFATVKVGPWAAVPVARTRASGSTSP